MCAATIPRPAMARNSTARRGLRDRGQFPGRMVVSQPAGRLHGQGDRSRFRELALPSVSMSSKAIHDPTTARVPPISRDGSHCSPALRRARPPSRPADRGARVLRQSRNPCGADLRSGCASALRHPVLTRRMVSVRGLPCRWRRPGSGTLPVRMSDVGRRALLRMCRPSVFGMACHSTG